MNKKMKNAIKDSFVFPESAHKDDFFRQTLPSYNDERKKYAPLIFRITAAAAALAMGAGVWNAVKTRPVHNVGNIEELPAVTTISETNEIRTTSVTSSEGNTVTTTKAAAVSAASDKTTTKKQKSVVTGTSGNRSDNKVTSAAASVSVSVNGTSAPRSSIAVTTDNMGLFPDEGGFSMKKISTFAASFVIAASSLTAPPVNASGEEFLKFQQQDFFEWFSTEARIVERLSGKEDTMDFNDDGKFDMLDVYAHFRAMHEMQYNNGVTYIYDDGSEKFEPPIYTVPDSIKANVKKNGDFNGDGDVNEDDFDVIAYYYSLNYPVTYDYVDPNYYYYHCPDGYNDYECKELFEEHTGLWTYMDLRNSVNSYFEKPLILFIQDFSDRTSRIDSGYSIFCDMVKRGIIDIDIDGDGKYTIWDMYDLIAGADLCYWESFPEYGEDSEMEKYGAARNTYYTKEEWEKLRKNVGVIGASLSYGMNNRDYYAAYLFDQIPFKKGYADQHYFDDYRGGFFKDSAYITLTDYLHYACPGIYSPRFDYTQDEIRTDFVNYYKKVKSGEFPEPDINMNGRIEFEDYIFADLILADDFLPDKSKYPDFDPKIIENFRKNCDFNDNEMSGDLSDVISIQLYVVKELGIPEDEVKNEMARYYKKHLEWDVYDYEHYVLPEESENNETEKAADTQPEFDGSAPAKSGVNAIKGYMSNIDIFIPRNGDANNDGNVDISDAVLIMQSFANPEKYKLTEEGRFNADVNSTGDGITAKDAQKIQMKLLGL